MQYPQANINPKLLTFSRERMGYEISVIAGKVPVKEERWVQWEKGEAKPSTKQLMKIAEKLDRTPAFFYLNEVPEEKEALSEFRTIKNMPLNATSPKLITAIREAKRNREQLFSFYESIKQAPQTVPQLSTLSGSVQDQSSKIREWLGVTFEMQSSWTSSSNALTEWKNLLEEKDIYITQFPFVEVDECRGFAIAEEQFPVIGINSKDSYNARVFTLIHELAHVFYRDSVLINDSLSGYFGNNQTLEQKCNRLTAEILVPQNNLSNEFERDRLSLREVNRLSNKFRVSGYVILIRLRKLNYITQNEYADLVPNFSFYDQSSGGGNSGNPYYNQIVRKGKLYLKAAFQNYFNDQINVAELANLTGWKVPNLNELAAKTFGWPEEGSYV
ncbi:MAG: XRE family transcriptional regulator [Balneolaceae bacterium]